MSIDINGEIKMSNCDVDLDEDFDVRSLSSMRMKKLVNSLEYISVADKENKENKQEVYSTLPLRKHNSVTGTLIANSPLKTNKRVHSVEIPVSALPKQTIFQTDLEQGVAKLRVTPGEAREIMKFINEKIASRTSIHTAGTAEPALPQQGNHGNPAVTLSQQDNVAGTDPALPDHHETSLRKEPASERSRGGSVVEAEEEEEMEEEDGRIIHCGFNSLPLLHRSGDISVKEAEIVPTPDVNDLNEEKPDGARPKLSFLNKLKKSFKSYSPDKNKSTPIPQLVRPPSAYIGSQVSLNGSVHSTTQLQHPHSTTQLQHPHSSTQQHPVHSTTQLHPVHSTTQLQHPAEKQHTPVLELLAKNPEMCSQDSLSRLPHVNAEVAGEERAVVSDPDIATSTTTARSRATRRGGGGGGDEKRKRRSRSRSLTKFFGDMARKAKSLTEASPVPRRSEEGQKSPDSPRYVNCTPADGGITRAPPPPLSPPPPLRTPEPDTETDKPEKKRLSLVGRIKRKLSIGKGDRTPKSKELSKSTPILTQAEEAAPSAVPRHIQRAKSTENMSTTSSTTTSTDVRTQIVLKSAKINKGCKCQVCTLVRRNIRSHCGSRDPNAKHKYEIVLKMSLLGADFMNSECGSVASYHEGHEERPVVEGNDHGYQGYDHGYHGNDHGYHGNEHAVVEGCIASNVSAEICSIHSIDQQLRTKTQREIEDIIHQETRSVSSGGSQNTVSSGGSHQNTDHDLSELRNTVSSPRQSAV